MTPKLTVRLSDAEMADLRALAGSERKTLSQVVKERLGLVDAHDATAWQEDVERRLSRLEELAGL